LGYQDEEFGGMGLFSKPHLPAAATHT